MKKLICVLMLALSLPVAMANMTQSKPAANNEDADFVAGKKAIERKDWKSAVDALSRALKRMPESADIHNYLGYAYRHLDDLNLSFTHYKEALRIDPNHRGAHEYIGEAYLKAGQPDKAAEHLARLEQICGKRCEEYQDLAKSIGAYQKGK
jgi:tetratricopeptide (TPR) repeat protein